MGEKAFRFDWFFFEKRMPISVPYLKNDALPDGHSLSLRDLKVPLKFSLLNLPHSVILVAGSG